MREGLNTSPVYTLHDASFPFKTSKPGTINALSYCNIHEVWEHSKKLEVK